MAAARLRRCGQRDGHQSCALHSSRRFCPCISQSATPAENTAALDGMQLAPPARAALPPGRSRRRRRRPLLRPSPASSAAPTPSPKLEPLKLAWITLWDTDAEDGDAVRIDSQGYSRTISLTKLPVTFAIPVPANGTINVTGHSRRRGWWHHRWLGLGCLRRPVFPIMSEGQTLGLKVIASPDESDSSPLASRLMPLAFLAAGASFNSRSSVLHHGPDTPAQPADAPGVVGVDCALSPGHRGWRYRFSFVAFAGLLS